MTFWDWFAHNPTAIYYVSAIIVGLFLFWLLAFLISLSKASSQVTKLAEYLTTLSQPIPIDERIAFDSRNSPVGDRFTSFVQHLIPSASVTGPILRATRSASELFDPDALLRESLNLRFYQSVPNILVGIGLLFTFLGLTIALHFAAQGATSNDITQTQASLNSLLQAAAFKFISSLVALSCSILFLIIERIALQRYQRKVERLIIGLERLFPAVTSESLLVDQLSDSHIERNAAGIVRASATSISTAFDHALGTPSVQLQLFLQNIERILSENMEQTASLKQFDTTLAISISKAIDESLGPTIVSTFGRLEAAIDQMSSKMQAANADVLQQMINDFSATLQGRTEESFNGVVRSAAALSETFVAQNDLLQSSFRGLAELAEAARIEGAAALDRVHGTIAELDSVVAKLTDTSSAMERSSAPLAAAATAVGEVITSLELVQRRSSDALESMTELTATLDGSLRSTADASRETAEMFKSQLAAAFKTYSDGFSEIDEDLTQAFEAMSEGITLTINRVRDFITDSDAGVARALQGVNAVVSGLESQLQDLEEILSKFFEVTGAQRNGTQPSVPENT